MARSHHERDWGERRGHGYIWVEVKRPLAVGCDPVGDGVKLHHACSWSTVSSGRYVHEALAVKEGDGLRGDPLCLQRWTCSLRELAGVQILGAGKGCGGARFVARKVEGNGA